MECVPLLEDPHLVRRLQSAGARTKNIEAFQRLAGDASTRIYYRARYADGSTAIIMLQPDPGQGQEESFLDVQRFLDNLSLPVPRIYFHDHQEGVVVLEDLGDDLLETAVQRCDHSGLRALYKKTVDLLLSMRRKTKGLDSGSVAFSLAFDEEKLMQEFLFFLTHFVKGLHGTHLSRKTEATLEEFFAKVSRILAAEPRIFTHRDYHSRNLVHHQGRLVMIDFQDARMGPVQYDLASVLRDSYVTVPEELVSDLLHYYAAESEESDEERFRYIFDVMSLQRNIKALGTFGYQLSVRGSDRYTSSIPRTGQYVNRNIAKYPEFARYRPAVEDLISGPAMDFPASP
jgi:aminoglycoside/choline kinase family phosphotransferase